MSEHCKNNTKTGFRLCFHLQKKNIPTFYTSHFIIFWCIKPELYNTLLSQIVKNIKNVKAYISGTEKDNQKKSNRFEFLKL